MVSDASAPCQANPTPNTGYYNALVPGLLQVPRFPTDLYFNVSQPAEWIAEYEMLHSVPDVTYEQIIETESTAQLRYLLRGASNPWMFHQANLRDLGGGQSLITDLPRRGAEQVRRARDVSRREPDDGRARAEDEGADGVRRGRGQRDDRARRRS